MERSVAIKKLIKILGKSLGYQVDSKAPTREEREAAQAELPAANAERERLSKAREARMQALLAADQEYQSLMTAWKAARERADKLRSISHHHKIKVGTTNSMFFHVRAEGDSWEEVIDKLTAKKEAA